MSAARRKAVDRAIAAALADKPVLAVAGSHHAGKIRALRKAQDRHGAAIQRAQEKAERAIQRHRAAAERMIRESLAAFEAELAEADAELRAEMELVLAELPDFALLQRTPARLERSAYQIIRRVADTHGLAMAAVTQFQRKNPKAWAARQKAVRAVMAQCPQLDDAAIGRMFGGVKAATIASMRRRS